MELLARAEDDAAGLGVDDPVAHEAAVLQQAVVRVERARQPRRVGEDAEGGDVVCERLLRVDEDDVGVVVEALGDVDAGVAAADHHDGGAGGQGLSGLGHAELPSGRTSLPVARAARWRGCVASGHTSYACAGSIACARIYFPRYAWPMAAGGTSAASDAADVGHLGFEALFASQHMQNQVTRLVDDALARAHGTNLTGFELLSRLERLPADGASVRFLSDHVLLSPSRVSRVVDEFVRRGVLERGASQQDGRLSLVRLTPEGREELAAMRATFNAAIEVHLLQRLTQEQVQALIEIGRAFGAPPCG